MDDALKMMQERIALVTNNPPVTLRENNTIKCARLRKVLEKCRERVPPEERLIRIQTEGILLQREYDRDETLTLYRKAMKQVIEGYGWAQPDDFQ